MTPFSDLTKIYADFFGKSVPSYNPLSIDFGTILETQRKNWQALTEIQQLALDSLQTIARSQSEIVTRMFESNSTIARELIGDGTPEQKVARQTDLARKSYEQSIAGWQGLAEAARKSADEAAEILSKRVTASFSEFKSAIEKSASNSNQQKSKAA